MVADFEGFDLQYVQKCEPESYCDSIKIELNYSGVSKVRNNGLCGSVSFQIIQKFMNIWVWGI